MQRLNTLTTTESRHYRWMPLSCLTFSAMRGNERSTCRHCVAFILAVCVCTSYTYLFMKQVHVTMTPAYDQHDVSIWKTEVVPAPGSQISAPAPMKEYLYSFLTALDEAGANCSHVQNAVRNFDATDVVELRHCRLADLFHRGGFCA